MKQLETIIIQIGQEIVRLSNIDNPEAEHFCRDLKDYIVFCSGYDTHKSCNHACRYSKNVEKTDREHCPYGN